MERLYCGINSCSCVDEDGYCKAWGIEENVETCRAQALEENLKNEVPGIKINEDYSDLEVL